MAKELTQAASRSLKAVLKIGLAAALIYWMIHKGALDFNTLSKIASPVVLAFFAVCVLVQIFINNYRWLILLRGQGLKSSVGHTLPLTFIGMFFNFFMPGGVGGDVVKGYYLLQDYPHRRLASAVSIFMDRVMGFFVMIATAFVALFFNWQIVMESPELRAIALGVTLLFVGFVVFFFLSLSRILQNKKLSHLLFVKLPGGHQIKKVYEVLHSYRAQPMALVHAAWLSLTGQLATVAFVYVVGQAMRVEVPLSGYLFLVPIGQVVQALPISPAGIGVGQAAFYFLFNLYLKHESQLGPTAVTASQAISFAWGLVGAFYYLRRQKPRLLEAKVEVEAEAMVKAP
jgi:uncharacterized protein (TIRG00374 family)